MSKVEIDFGKSQFTLDDRSRISFIVRPLRFQSRREIEKVKKYENETQDQIDI
ncbi:hypothetical protein KHM19_03780 [Leptospira borgpetersenii]|nr:hypothetical protein KHM09_05910 [Leptospira borgpetersenii]GIM21195.1 hypothetical protein KHM19_03780 [Leptospira borgpetersenii]GIM24453.1 hypothetical protein KHM25_03780 [Leptospira borgpetersenii]